MLGMALLFIGFHLIVIALWLQGKCESKDVGLMALVTGLLATGNVLWTFFHGGDGSTGMLFAFTYLWLAYNATRGATDQRAFGYYCLLVAITTVPEAFLAFKAGSPMWAFEWASYGILWYMFYVLLAVPNNTILKPCTAMTYFVGIEVAITGYLYTKGGDWVAIFGNWWPFPGPIM
ncbi:MAG: AmiS/UreI family transporter [Burkholderiales bacterium]